MTLAPAVAGNGIDQPVAAAVGGRCNRQRQVLNIAKSKREIKAAAACTRSSARTGILINNIAGIIHHIGVISSPADKRVGTNAAIQDVIADAATNGVGKGIPYR